MSPRALITGGQQGIGLGIARALAEAGFHLTLAAEQPETASTVREGLAQLPAGTRYLRHDLADIAAIPALLAEVEAEGQLTTLISNSGVPAMQRGDLLEMTAESFDRCHAVNLRGTFFLAQAVARAMAARHSPQYRSLIFVTSVSAETDPAHHGHRPRPSAAPARGLRGGHRTPDAGRDGKPKCHRRRL